MTKYKKALVILGGTSAVGISYARLEAARGRPIVLVGRNEKALKANAADLQARGAEYAKTLTCDLGASAEIVKNWALIQDLAGNQLDEVLLAYGLLGDQDTSQADMVALQTLLETNFVSAAMWSELAFAHMAYNGHGQLTVIGSVAGDRGRQSNYLYGSTKAALEVLCDGMAHRAAKLKESEVKVLLVKPGFIDSPMTDHLDKGGLLWATPDKIAEIIQRGVRSGREKIYAPWFWRFILLIIRNVPKFVFHKTGL